MSTHNQNLCTLLRERIYEDQIYTKSRVQIPIATNLSRSFPLPNARHVKISRILGDDLKHRHIRCGSTQNYHQ